MKRKYFLRGLGLGLITATLMMMIALLFYQPSLSDDEIRRRAKELGMTETEEQEDTKKTDASKKTDGKDSKKNGESASDSSDSKDASKDEKTGESDSSTDASQAQNSDDGTNTETVTNPNGSQTTTTTVDAGEQTGGESTGKLINFGIAGGENSEAVSQDLYSKGLVQSAEDFDKYMASQGKDHYLKAGTYQIPEGSTYSQILSMISN